MVKHWITFIAIYIYVIHTYTYIIKYLINKIKENNVEKKKVKKIVKKKKHLENITQWIWKNKKGGRTNRTFNIKHKHAHTSIKLYIKVGSFYLHITTHLVKYIFCIKKFYKKNKFTSHKMWQYWYFVCNLVAKY